MRRIQTFSLQQMLHWEVSLELQKIRILPLIAASAQRTWSRRYYCISSIMAGENEEVRPKERGTAAARSFLSKEQDSGLLRL